MDRRSWLWLLALSAIWGASYLLIKIGLGDLSPEIVACGRIALAALVLLPFAASRDALRPFHEFDAANDTWPRGNRPAAIREAAAEFRARFATRYRFGTDFFVLCVRHVACRGRRGRRGRFETHRR